MGRKRRIAMLGLGGTISSVGVSDPDVLDYPELGRRLSVDEVVELVPQVHAVAEVSKRDVLTGVSTSLSVADWFALRSAVREAFRDGAEGVVILHGTGSLEETAYFLHLSIDNSLPIVMVGSQRPMTTIGSDAPMNLLAAVRTAVTPAASGAGVLVVMNDEVHSARFVQKLGNRRPNAFESPGHGPMGSVDGDQVTISTAICTRHTVNSALNGQVETPDLRVDIVYSYVGGDATAIHAFVEAGARGLVCAGFPPGSATPSQRQALREAAESGISVVQSSRAVRDRVVPRAALQEAGFVASRDLNPQKARVLLLLALNAGITDTEELNRLFATH